MNSTHNNIEEEMISKGVPKINARFYQIILDMNDAPLPTPIEISELKVRIKDVMDEFNYPIPEGFVSEEMDHKLHEFRNNVRREPYFSFADVVLFSWKLREMLGCPAL